MLGRTHAVTGAAAYLAAAPVAGVRGAELAAGAGIAALAALGPDIDHPGAKLPRIVPILGPLVARLVSKASGGHRQGTHSLLAALLVTTLTALVVNPLWVPLAVALGWLAHLAGDSLTPGGVPWLWPFTQARLSWPITKTGGAVEALLRAACWVAVAWLAVDAYGAWPYVRAGWEYLS